MSKRAIRIFDEASHAFTHHQSGTKNDKSKVMKIETHTEDYT